MKTYHFEIGDRVFLIDEPTRLGLVKGIDHGYALIHWDDQLTTTLVNPNLIKIPLGGVT